MSNLTPTPVPLQDLLTAGADINLFNDGVKTQSASPRDRGLAVVTVQVKDDPLAQSETSGTATATTADHLIDSANNFLTDGTVEVGDAVINTTTFASAIVTAVADGDLTVDADVFLITDTYRVIKPAFWTQKDGTGEWTKNVNKTGNNARVSYSLPTPGTASAVIVNNVVVPVTAPEDTGNYPPATNY